MKLYNFEKLSYLNKIDNFGENFKEIGKNRGFQRILLHAKFNRFFIILGGGQK